MACDLIFEREDDRPLRVAIDGITAAGKTTFANSLADEVRTRGRTVIRVSMDGFHHPRAVRYRQGRGSADGYYEDAYDFESVRDVLLNPLGPDGDLRYRTAIIDLDGDAPLNELPQAAGQRDVLIADGSFLQKPEVRPHWDIVIFLRTSFAAAEERGVRRDSGALGGEDLAREAFRTRYHAAQRRYLAECDPESSATMVIDVEVPTQPSIVR